MKNGLTICLFALSTLIMPSFANAEARIFGTAGGFDVAGQPSTRDEKGACIATFEYDGPGSTKTTLYRTLSKDRGDIVWLSVVNYEWSAKEGDMYKLKYIFDDGTYERDAFGIKTDNIYKGFMAGFPADEFLSTYAKSNSLHILMGSNVVDRLKLSGSTAGVALFNRCWSWVLSTERIAQNERDRYKGIPRDPFDSSN